jgi:hypothetical protein
VRPLTRAHTVALQAVADAGCHDAAVCHGQPCLRHSDIHVVGLTWLRKAQRSALCASLSRRAAFLRWVEARRGELAVLRRAGLFVERLLRAGCALVAAVRLLRRVGAAAAAARLRRAGCALLAARFLRVGSVRERAEVAALRLRVAAAFFAEALRSRAGRAAARLPPMLPPFSLETVVSGTPRPLPDRLPPPDSLLTVAQARRSASFVGTPRSS